MPKVFPQYIVRGPEGKEVDVAANLRFAFGTKIGGLIPQNSLDRISEGTLSRLISATREQWNSFEIHHIIEQALDTTYETKFMPIEETRSRGFNNTVHIITNVKGFEVEETN